MDLGHGSEKGPEALVQLGRVVTGGQGLSFSQGRSRGPCSQGHLSRWNSGQWNPGLLSALQAKPPSWQRGRVPAARNFPGSHAPRVSRGRSLSHPGEPGRGTH